MAVLSPRSLEADLPETGVDQPSRSAVGQRFTLRQLMKAVAASAVFLAIVVRPQELLDILVSICLILLLVDCVSSLIRRLSRVRLAIKLAAACFLLTYSAWTWQPPFYDRQVERCEDLIELCSTLAVHTDDARIADRFRREVAEYRHMARMLRIRAMWDGLLRAFTREHVERISDREMIRAFELHRALDRHYEMARKRGLVYPWW